MRFVVVGAGAIGGTVGAGLVRDGHEVLFCDADPLQVQAMNETGLHVEGPVEAFTVPATAVLPGDLPDRVEAVVLLAVKAHHTAAAADLLRGRLFGGSHVVTLQNGLTADLVAAAVGRAAVLPAFVNFGADVVGPGRILRGNRGAIRVGELDGTLSERARAFAAAVPDAVVTDSILGFEWGKLAYGAWLYATALSGQPIADVLGDARYRALLLALGAEVVGRAPVPLMAFDGFDPADLPASLARMTTFNRASAKTHSGIHRDLAVRHRRTEVDAHLAGPLAGAPLLGRLVELVHAIEDGRRSCEPSTLDLLATHERVRRLGGPLNAVAAVIGVPERAATGVLAGTPVAAKDIIAVTGVVAHYGSTLPVDGPDAVPAHVDAPVVARLRAAGAEVCVTSQCLEYAAGSVHPAVGGTRNPRDPSRTSGGSSGGSAALVAAGAVPLAVGTDTGGSIRIPAAYCGVVGLKPTRGLVPTGGVFPLSPTCDHVGPIAADVAGTRLLLSVLADRPDLAADAARAGADAGPPTLGVLRGHLADPCVSPEVRDAVESALAVLARAGWQLVDVEAAWVRDGAAAERVLNDVVLHEAALVHADRLPRLRRFYGPGTLAVIDAGAEVAADRYRVALVAAGRLTEAVDEALDGTRGADGRLRVDALVGPTVPTVAPAQDPPFGDGEDPEGRFTCVTDLTGHPALSLPVPVTGLPVGLQLTGRIDGDGALLSIAAAVEEQLSGRVGP